MKSIIYIIGIIAMACCTSACKSSRNSVSKQETVTEQAVTIIEKYWKLIEINGNPVIVGESVSREAFIILKQEGNLVNGNGGCNTLSGTYEIDPAIYRIKFSQMVTTMMACMNMEVETELKKVLEMADSYSLSPDGKYLSLNRARMAPLARFEAVYLK